MPGKKEKKKIIPLHPVAENPDEDVLDDDPSFVSETPLEAVIVTVTQHTAANVTTILKPATSKIASIEKSTVAVGGMPLSSSSTTTLPGRVVAKAQNNLAHWEDALKIVKGMMKSTGVAGHDKAKDKVKNGFVNVEKQIADSEGKEEKDGQEKKKRKKAKKGKGKGRSTKRSMGVR